ncbi:DNA cytosine methyltransferase [Tenacibaculum finnmarkense genomovar finnmarkense]|uniref:DNA cytosine methyltransferase n=1 Tax=Tenacibaculum finnmarkense TaxID=2781243 RepID=UPI001EFB3DED|nr:DNA cytosine methyltransferase [Tenacibaculum finnmarkense]MCG8213460.1 DNA cytosine methyltransferase [Tenacibaculum finnmarkense genomovar finnmarkense]MCG8231773.1 DNA cytosine methyltransferase [Tenacibaculum finnmarkense genomovar finnmarkense]MCG8242113.1 DNA cytosine methyltransferase [Tenacibaculum finnmarkense genomovar finnmarkense]MCG8718903.1 methyltransferase [Tenacibaculum finnmarkense]MCG8726646.1 methyltransferase [Tenacibaculum finnmarkense]
MKKQLTYISLFSSAGVGCYGFKMNGFECIATNELLTKRIKIQVYNNKCRYQNGYLDGDISLKEIKDKLFKEINFWKEKHKIKEPDVIIATPPCQGMSVANHKKKSEKNRNSLVVQSIKITKEVRPKFFIFENVRAFLNTICTDIDGVDKSIDDAIKFNLGGDYNILTRIVNFKEYGSNSSRTRTLVIGVRKDLQNITPFDIFPKNKKAKTLRNLIGDLPSLTEMGEISEDIFHSYRTFDQRMLPWIENLEEGQSAFENIETSRIPHRIIDGIQVFNQSKNGDKYARWYWDREGPCVHTRNDILSSQNTVHPSDNRVFSIRELMRMMSIPKTFEWSNIKTKDLNKLSLLEKKMFVKKEELNIRHCLGEAVPTGVFESIASNIKKILENKTLTINQIKGLVEKHELNKTEKLIDFINDNFDNYSLDNLFLISELSNYQRQETSAYFTRKDIGFTVVKDLPILKKKKKIKILEPSAGVGNFLPLLFEKYKDKTEVILDVCDIDFNSLQILKTILKKTKVPANFKLNFINTDFLLWSTKNKYDIVVGNPPYMKITKNKELLSRYKFGIKNTDTNNIFSFFIEKSLQLANYVSLIVPKSLLNSPEFNKTRDLMNSYNLEKICDYGEKGFKGVKIETVSFLINTNVKIKSNDIIIESYINNTYSIKGKNYIFSNDFPYWLIYRNETFDDIVAKMNLDIFLSFRDRQITKALTKESGKIRVLKARNVGNNEIKDLENYDKYVNEYQNFTVSKFLNEKDIVMIPNLTYYPRATFLPKNSITDGSVALLTLKNGSRLATKKDLEFYSTKEFENYYRIARNHGTRSLNIDNNSVYFFGLLKETKK